MKVMENNKNSGVQLITYADSLGNNLSDLKYVLDNYFKPVITGVHILPFYPSSADRGFAPLTHREINPKFGTASDIKKISENYELMADLIVNHVSKESKYFQDYLKKGNKSKYRNFFIKARYFSRHWFNKRPRSRWGLFWYYAFGQAATIGRNLDFIFHKHGVNRLILKKIYRPRPGSPFVKFKRFDGSSRLLWCTFSPDQIDLNIKSSAVRRKFRRDIKYLEKLGVKYLRLDAVAYAGKRRGTNNFLIPETLNFIKWLAKHAHGHGMKIIPEVHFHYKTQLSLSSLKGVDYIYDFALPFLTLNALFSGEGEYLKNWIKIRPNNCLTNLDTHDGIGVIDVKGLIPEKDIEMTSKRIYENGGNSSMRASGNGSNNVDVYQINCSYYSALAENDRAYLAARAIQLFIPGIPQIYYVGILAGKNDEDLLLKTNVGRDINRHYYSVKEIEEECQRAVVKELFELCKLRNNHPAFNGDFSLLESGNNEIILLWKKDRHKIKLWVDLKTYQIKIEQK
jgi:sucrose phosphorylase